MIEDSHVNLRLLKSLAEYRSPQVYLDAALSPDHYAAQALHRLTEWCGARRAARYCPTLRMRHMTGETTAVATVQLETEKVRVTEWRFPPGTQTGWHTHEMDYVVVPTIEGTLRIHAEDGVVDNVLRRGASYTRERGSVHNVVNESAAECAFVEIELKPQG